MTENTFGSFYTALQKLFGRRGKWWPCDSGNRWEIVIGAILTQNCAWHNVELALSNLRQADLVTPEAVVRATDADLQALIRPAGFYRQKANYCQAMAAFYLDNQTSLCHPLTQSEIQSWRQRLLQIKGVGKETADSILLYAFDQPIFVIDSYTRRICQRHLHCQDALTCSYEKLQTLFMQSLPPDAVVYQEYHGLLVTLAKNSCGKTSCGQLCQKLF